MRVSSATQMIVQGHCLDRLDDAPEAIDLLVTDPPYAFGGSGKEHELPATVAIALREYGKRVVRGGWALVFCASSWRSSAYMVESLRGVMEPVRIATWVKPAARTKARTPGWAWASVNVIAFRKGKGLGDPSEELDWIECAPVTNGRRAQLPDEVCRWVVRPFRVPGGMAVDPFAGSGRLLVAARDLEMKVWGCEVDPSE